MPVITNAKEPAAKATNSQLETLKQHFKNIDDVEVFIIGEMHVPKLDIPEAEHVKTIELANENDSLNLLYKVLEKNKGIALIPNILNYLYVNS